LGKPLKGDYWDAFTDYYGSLVARGQLENMEMLKLLFAFLKDNDVSNICDLGCACGALLKILRSHGYMDIKYFGFDLAGNSVEVAKKLFPNEFFLCLDITVSDLPDSYDVVFSSEMLSHIPLLFHGRIIEKILRHSRKLALFSMKYCEVESFEHRVWNRGHVALYVYPNIDDIVEVVKNVVDSKVVVHKKREKWNFLKETEHYEKTGNVTLICQKDAERTFQFLS